MPPPTLAALGLALESLTEAERQGLQRMHELFDDASYPEKNRPGALFCLNDYLYYKYLRAAEFKVDRARDLLSGQLEWRRKTDPENLKWIKGFHKEVTIMGKTRFGHPVLFCKMSNWQPEKYTEDTYMKSRAIEMEQARQVMAKDGWRVDRIVVINDMRGYRIFDLHSFRLAKVLMQIFSYAYLDSVEVIYLLNAPMAFQGFWEPVRRVIQNFITGGELLSRIRFVNDSNVLLEMIEPEELYEEYGGSKQDDYRELVEWSS